MKHSGPGIFLRMLLRTDEDAETVLPIVLWTKPPGINSFTMIVVSG